MVSQIKQHALKCSFTARFLVTNSVWMLDIIVDILDQAVLSECLNWYIIVDILDQAVLCRVAKEETCEVVEDTYPRGTTKV